MKINSIDHVKAWCTEARNKFFFHSKIRNKGGGGEIIGKEIGLAFSSIFLFAGFIFRVANS